MWAFNFQFFFLSKNCNNFRFRFDLKRSTSTSFCIYAFRLDALWHLFWLIRSMCWWCHLTQGIFGETCYVGYFKPFFLLHGKRTLQSTVNGHTIWIARYVKIFDYSWKLNWVGRAQPSYLRQHFRKYSVFFFLRCASSTMMVALHSYSVCSEGTPS